MTMIQAPLSFPPPGIVSKDVVQALDGMQFLQGLMDGHFPPAPIAVLLGFHPSELAPGRAVFSAVPDARHNNPLGTVHGGYASTLLDSLHGLRNPLQARDWAGFYDTRAEGELRASAFGGDWSGEGYWHSNSRRTSNCNG
jgi:hypothetical protein